jgi:hypothetical protein
MSIAALPNDLQEQCFTRGSLGMRFGMYLNLWSINGRTHEVQMKHGRAFLKCNFLIALYSIVADGWAPNSPS